MNITLIQAGDRWQAEIVETFNDSKVRYAGYDATPHGALGRALMAQYPELERPASKEFLNVRRSEFEDVEQAVDTAIEDLNSYLDRESAEDELLYIQRRLSEILG